MNKYISTIKHLLKTFKNESSIMDTTIKCAYANQLISADKWRGQLAIRNEEGVVLSDAKPAKYAYLTGSIL